MDFWADGERKSIAEDSETIPEEEVLNLEDPGVVDHLQVRAAAHGPRGHCLPGWGRLRSQLRLNLNKIRSGKG